MALTKNMIYRLYFRTHTTPLHPAGNSLDATGGSITSWSKNSVHERRFITHGWPVWVVSTGGVCWVGLQITSGNDCLTFPQQSWKQSISSGYCSNDRDVCTPSGRVVRSLERCHSDSHTHTQTGKKKKKKDAFSLSNTVQNLIHANTLVVTEYGATPASAPAPVLVLIVNSSQGTDKHKYFLYLLTRINTDTVFE